MASNPFMSHRKDRPDAWDEKAQVCLVNCLTNTAPLANFGRCCWSVDSGWQADQCFKLLASWHKWILDVPSGILMLFPSASLHNCVKLSLTNSSNSWTPCPVFFIPYHELLVCWSLMNYVGSTSIHAGLPFNKFALRMVTNAPCPTLDASVCWNTKMSNWWRWVHDVALNPASIQHILGWLVLVKWTLCAAIPFELITMLSLMFTNSMSMS